MSVGHNLHKDGNGPYLGFGKNILLRYSFGGQLHNILVHLKKCNWLPDTHTRDRCTKYGFNMESILQARKLTGIYQFDQIDNAFSFFEWNNLTNSPYSPTVQENSTLWTHKRPIHSAHLQSRNKWEWEQPELLQTALRMHYINWEQYIVTDIVNGESVKKVSTHNNYGKILNFIMERGSPIVVATDGAHREDQEDKTLVWNTSAAIVLCSLDIRPNESLETLQWAHRPMIPLLCRTAVLPAELGTTKSDIAHGECFAVIMEELLMDPNIPRIVIMDSEAVRNHVRNMRDCCNDEVDRSYVREHAGGISKFFASILRKSFRKMVQRNNITEPTQWIRNIMQTRNEMFLKLTEQWIACESNSETTNLTWRRDYFDNNTARAVLKINSHQLSKCGTRIQKPSRYESLTPNLAFLNANHHADFCADLAFQHVQGSNNEMIKDARTMQLPFSNLTFFLTCNGKLLDRHVSTYIRHILSKECIKRLSKKSTQGLLWRILKHTTSTWKTLSCNVGLFRSLLGMSNTHTRCLYKSSPYRTGYLLEHTEHIQDPEQKEAILKSPISSQMKLISNCKWCNQNNLNQHKGNRRHMFLICNDENISKFRNRMNNTVGNRFAIFINELQENSSITTINGYIRKINQDLRMLQEEQIGRLSPLPNHRNNSYLHIDELLKKLEMSSVTEAIIKSPVIFFSHILGIVPEYSNIELNDEEMGAIDGPWLGLTPSCIDDTTKKYIHNISCKLFDRDDAAICKTRLLQSWREVKALILGRAAGIHKVINFTSEKKEAELVEKYHLQELVEKGKTKRRKRQRMKCEEARQQQPIRKKVKSQDPRKRCNGITCSEKKDKWCYRNNFKDNSINLNRRRCQRCAIFACAMKKTENILQEMVEATNSKNTNWKKIINAVQQTEKHAQIQYPSLMNMLKAGIPAPTYFTRAQYIRKNRPTEQWKRICRIMIAAINATITTLDGTSPQAILQKSMQAIRDIMKEKSIELKLDLAELKKCVLELQQDSATKQTEVPPIETKTQQSTSIHIIKIPDSEEEKQPSENVKRTQLDGKHSHAPIVIDESEQEINGSSPNKTILTISSTAQSTQEIQDALINKLDILSRRSLMSGTQLTMAVDILRYDHTEINVFLACTEATSIIDSWEPHQGWRRFARIFRSTLVSHRKPDGVYLIPAFSGDNGCGH